MDKIDKISQAARQSVPFTGKKEGFFRGAADVTLFAAVLVAAVISLGQVSLTLSAVRDVSLLVALLYVLATLIYRNRYSCALERGKRTQDYLSAYSEYDGLRRGLFEKGLSAKVPAFCAEYVIRELESYREGLLAEVGLTYADYVGKYRGKSVSALKKECSLNRYAVRAVMKCERAKGIKLNKNMILLSDGDAVGRNRPFGISSKARQRRDYRMNLIVRLSVTVLSGIIAVDFMIDPSLNTLIEWCVRMVPIISAAFFGSSNGYLNATETAVNYLGAQIIKLREIEEWCSEKEKAENAPQV